MKVEDTSSKDLNQYTHPFFMDAKFLRAFQIKKISINIQKYVIWLNITLIIAIGIVACVSTPSEGTTINVPGDFSSIQAAHDAASAGDTILVAPGTYVGQITITKAITLASHYHTTGDPSFIDQTTIDGGSPAIDVGETAAGTVIKGLRFTRGSKSVQFFSHGSSIANHFDNTGSDAISFERIGGVAIGNVCFSPSDDCIDVDHPESDVLIENNIMDVSGDDGIEIRNGNYSGALVTITIRDNIITGSDEDGIQIIDYSENSNRKFIIEGNLIRTSTDVGLGLMDNGETNEDFRAASMPERIHVFNNTFDANTYGITGGDNLIAVNNIISNSSVLGIKNTDNTSIVAHTLFWGNATDHIGSNVDAITTVNADPLYAGDFSLQIGSPAINAGTATFIWHAETVLDMPESSYNGPAPDIGAFESDFTDADGDGIPDDGDMSGIAGDNPCTGGTTIGCDDNCIDTPNTNQDDADIDKVGDVCDVCPLSPPARTTNVPPVYYSKLQDAYDDAADLAVIQSQAIVFTENLLIGMDISVTLKGGYDCDYNDPPAGETTLIGTMTITETGGTLTIESGTFEVQ